MLSSPVRYVTKNFTSAGEVDQFWASKARSPAHSTYHLRTAALGYYNVEAYGRAENLLRKYMETIDDANDIEALEALASASVKVGKFRDALVLHERLLELQPNSHTLLLAIAKLHLRVAKASQTPTTRCDNVEKALVYLPSCRYKVDDQMTRDAIDTLEKAYQFIAEQCPECATPELLLPRLLQLARVPETWKRRNLHGWLLRAVLRSAVPASGWNYVTSQREAMASSLDWISTAVQFIDDITDGCTNDERELDIAELKLWLHATHIRLLLQKKPLNDNGVKEAFQSLETALNDIVELLPIAKNESNRFFADLRSEYLAQCELLGALSVLHSLASKTRTIADTKHQQSQIRATLDHLRLCLSFRMSSQDVRLARAATTRLTVATHAILAILYTFDYGWLFSDSLHSPTKVGHSHLKQHPRLSNEIEFPTLTLPESSETEEVIPRDVMVLLGWMHKSLAAIDEPVLKHGNENLAEYIHVVAWHYSTDSFREDLRNVLPRAVETFQRSGSVSDRKASHTRPQLTLADIDAFILMLLIQRQAWCRQRKHAGSSGVEYLSAIGAWKPTELQQRFWLTALGKLGDPDDQCPADNILDEESFAQAIRDIRGVSASGQLLTASDGTGVHRRAVYGSIGLLYTRLSNRQPVRFKEAHHFLSVWESLVDDAEDGADLGETVVFDPEVQMASIDEADIKNAIQELTARNEGLAKKQSSLNLSLNSVSPRPVKVDSPLPSEDPTPSPENEASQQDVPGSDNAYAAVFSPVNSLPRTPNGRYVNRDSQGRLDVDRFAAPDGSESSHRPQASVKEELGKDVGRVSQLTPSRKPQAVQTPASARTRRHFQELEAMRKPPTEALQDSVSNGSSSPASVYGTPMRDTPIRASTAQFTGRYQPETPISHYYTPSAGEGSSIPVIRRPPFSSPAPSLIRLSVAQVEPAQESVTMGESFIQAPAPPSSPFWSKSPAGKSPAAPKTVAFDRETEPRETGQAHDEKNDDDEDLAEKEEKTVGLEKADRKMLPRFQLSGISHTPKRNPRELIGNRGDMSELRRRAHVKNAQLRFEGGQPDSNSSMMGSRLNRQLSKLGEMKLSE